FREYYTPLASFAHVHVDSRDLAEEIVQDVFLHLWTHRTEWQVTTHLRSYLYTATLNRVRSVHRTHRVREHRDRPFAQDRSDATGGAAREHSDDSVRAREVAGAIRSAIAMLPDRTREIFLLNRDAGLRYREIAVKLGVTVKTVEFHMARALVSLREQ